MQEEHPLAMSPRHGWRRAELVAGTPALTLASFGTVAAVEHTCPASRFARLRSATGLRLVTNTYTIGAPSGGVNNVTVTAPPPPAGISQSYTVTFVWSGLWPPATRSRSVTSTFSNMLVRPGQPVDGDVDLGLVPAGRDHPNHHRHERPGSRSHSTRQPLPRLQPGRRSQLP